MPRDRAQQTFGEGKIFLVLFLLLLVLAENLNLNWIGDAKAWAVPATHRDGTLLYVSHIRYSCRLFVQKITFSTANAYWLKTG